MQTVFTVPVQLRTVDSSTSAFDIPIYRHLIEWAVKAYITVFTGYIRVSRHSGCVCVTVVWS